MILHQYSPQTILEGVAHFSALHARGLLTRVIIPQGDDSVIDLSAEYATTLAVLSAQELRPGMTGEEWINAAASASHIDPSEIAPTIAGIVGLVVEQGQALAAEMRRVAESN